MCDCMKTVLGKLEEAAKPKEKVLDYKIKWKGQVLRFDGGCPVGLYMEQSYVKIKNDGSAYKNRTKDERFVALSFCPFCGEKFEEGN